VFLSHVCWPPEEQDGYKDVSLRETIKSEAALDPDLPQGGVLMVTHCWLPLILTSFMMFKVGVAQTGFLCVSRLNRKWLLYRDKQEGI